MVGLWKAKKRFGPDARGPLIIQKTGVDYIADLAGRKVAVVMDTAELTFVLPDNTRRLFGCDRLWIGS